MCQSVSPSIRKQSFVPLQDKHSLRPLLVSSPLSFPSPSPSSFLCFLVFALWANRFPLCRENLVLGVPFKNSRQVLQEDMVPTPSTVNRKPGLEVMNQEYELCFYKHIV